MSDCRSSSGKYESQLGHITFVEIDHEIIGTVILLLLMIQEWQLSVWGGGKVSCILCHQGVQLDIGLQLDKACYPCSR